MKRVQAACICQTLHFLLKDDLEHDFAAQLVREEVAHYKAGLEKSRVKYRITEETVQPDDSVVIRIIRQYNQCSVGDYLG